MTRIYYHSPEKANIGGERNCHSFRGLCRGGSVPFFTMLIFKRDLV